MDRSIKSNGLANLVALLVVAGGSAILASMTKAWVILPSVAFLAVGFVVAVLSYFQMRLEEAERLEKLEYDEISKSPTGSSLFSADESELLPTRRSREQFERWLIPGFTVLLMGFQAFGVWWFWKKLGSAGMAQIQQGRLAMALFGLFSLLLFLLGKYSAGLARLEGRRLVRPGASYLLLGAYLSFLCTVAIAASDLGFPKVDLYAAKMLVVVLGLTSIELLFNLILEIYRPRVRGQAARLLYESRVIGLLGQPEGLVTTAAQALDYQFGFKVSETWFYKFLERALAWLILLQLGALFASTTFVIIEPQEQALLERFGRPVQGREILEPGFHFKMPWPVDSVHRYITREIQSFTIGVIPDAELENERVLVWTKPHSKEEFNLLVANGQSSPVGKDTSRPERDQAVPVNLLTVRIPVQYRITNLLEWATGHSDGPELLEDIATREVVRYLVSVDIERLMGVGRLEAAETMMTRVQKSANEARLGAEIVFLGLQDIHPPVKVAKEFEAVIGAMQERETNILEAVAYSASVVPAARAAATNLLTRAGSDRLSKLATVMAEATLFTNQIAAHAVAPAAYARRAYLETVARSVASARKYIITTTNTEDVIQLNLEDKLRPDLLDIQVPPKR